MKEAHRLGIHGFDRIVQELTRELDRHPHVVFAYLFGSCAESLPFHDVDVGVFLLDPGEHAATAMSLAPQLSTALGLPVDVRILNGAPSSFLYHVLRGKMLISRDDEFLCSLIERTAQRYLDIAPLRRRAMKEAFSV